MNVNQSSVIRVLRAALLAFALFLIGYMLPHPGAMATPAPQGGGSGSSVPGGFAAVGQVTINPANLTCSRAGTCSYPLNIMARKTAGTTSCTYAACTAFNSSAANFTVNWYDQNGHTPWKASQLYASGKLGK
jgi:hypothetical protein